MNLEQQTPPPPEQPIEQPQFVSQPQARITTAPSPLPTPSPRISRHRMQAGC
ncbi:hypothetical protein MWN34_17085 [Ancylobacter sp. 6x-1]|uniref:Uncharacterized protein n=1 Tax=Ancylobacter crimeensis TaxID=2579147 RepID=A0ABT0DF76_9HYPH|nr:hypothetical protein [Ancylobacter crimeensis]MCK0198615.1 hypothetical protein [Ancylobacter crimeensis]